MSPFPTPTSLKPFWKHRAYWYGSFRGRTRLFALFSGVGGTLASVLVGTQDWLTYGYNVHSLWYCVSITLLVNTLLMMGGGLLVGSVVCAVVALAGRKWSMAREGRFSLYFARRLLFPLLVGLNLTALLVASYWYIVYAAHANTDGCINGYTFSETLAETELEAEFVALPVLSIVLALSSAYLSKKKKRNSLRVQKRAVVLPERLLPLD